MTTLILEFKETFTKSSVYPVHRHKQGIVYSTKIFKLCFRSSLSALLKTTYSLLLRVAWVAPYSFAYAFKSEHSAAGLIRKADFWPLQTGKCEGGVTCLAILSRIAPVREATWILKQKEFICTTQITKLFVDTNYRYITLHSNSFLFQVSSQQKLLLVFQLSSPSS